MLNLEARTPVLVSGAVRKAYAQTLTGHGRVIEAVNGELVKFTVEGQRRLLKAQPTPTRVTVGLRRVRCTTSNGCPPSPVDERAHPAAAHVCRAQRLGQKHHQRSDPHERLGNYINPDDIE
jgi:hypothetical protein